MAGTKVERYKQTPQFEAWLAGMIDAAGSFYIKQFRAERPKDGQEEKRPRNGQEWGGNFICGFRLTLSRKDREVVEKLIATLGWGRLDGHPPERSAMWVVEKREECLAFAIYLDRIGLRTSKNLEFRVWFDAVAYWDTLGGRRKNADWFPITRYKEELAHVSKGGERLYASDAGWDIREARFQQERQSQRA